MSPDPLQFLTLVPVAAAAGCLDAIAGGGGLLTVPALALAGFDPLTAIATNKLQGSFGSGSATLTYLRSGLIDRGNGPWVAAAAFGGSAVGALAVSSIPQQAVGVALPFVLLAVAIYFAASPRFDEDDSQHRVGLSTFTATFVPAIGFYDGVFGPGAGSFYMAGFMGLLGLGLIKAVAHTKLANFASNLAALGVLALSGHVIWTLGLAMGAGQFLGARLGVAITIRHGARIVKPLIVTISLALAAKLAMAPDYPLRIWLIGR